MKLIQFEINWLIFSFVFVFSSAQKEQVKNDDNELLLSIVIFREGDRTPLILQENDPFMEKWVASGLGILTKVGRKKMHSFGKYLQKRYKTNLDPIKLRKSITVHSVEYDRHIRSAREVITGLLSTFPRSIRRPYIPIITDSTESVRMIEPCPAYEKELQNFIHKNNTFSQLDLDEKDIYNLIQQNTKCSCNSFRDVKKCVDPMVCERSEGLGLPSWCNETCYQRVMHLLDMDWKVEVSDPKLLNLRMQPFVDLMLKKMNGYVTGSEKEFQLFLYSSIGYAIPVLMDSIGVDNITPHVPKFGAALIVELRDVGGKKIVNMYYQSSKVGELKKLSIRGCGEDCEYSEILKLLPPLLKKKRLSCAK
ncbi:testicular acid phosphatase homolog [Coccinella septempunctata]|uniref:testicular acid phosphatase homolog n=1 Tax=Coccinella septempunctata TaxID=41139 RepID=UPI001D091B3A|nr:testicular acid phosphatase homolog [Coccinella septempunctata]